MKQIFQFRNLETHQNGKVGVLLEVNCESDFVAGNEDFKTFCHDVAMHIAATNPLCVRVEEIDASVLEKEKEIFRAQTVNDEKNANKPEAIIEKIVEGKVSKFYKESVLMEQSFVKDDSMTITQLVNEITLMLDIQLGTGNGIHLIRACIQIPYVRIIFYCF